QRDQLPLIFAGIGPAAIPTLIDSLNDPHEHVRAVAAAALGQLHARTALPLLVQLREDPSSLVRQSLVEALGQIGGPGAPALGQRRWWARKEKTSRGRLGGFMWWRKPSVPPPDPTATAVTTLRAALADPAAAVRIQAAAALGQIGPAATAATGDLIPLLKDS